MERVVRKTMLRLTAIDHCKVVFFRRDLRVELPVEVHALAYVLVNHTVSEDLNGGWRQ